MSVRLDHGEDTLDEVHEINVTPFIDVMLVLLIIFMVAAPLATVDIAVNLPVSRQSGAWSYWVVETDCMAGHVRLELRNVAVKNPFERSHIFPGNSAEFRL
jgi:biopolymer transport protein ExbD/TolR